MKTKLAILAAIAAMSELSSATITLSGAALKNVQGSPDTDLPSNNLGLLIVDTQGDGFLKGMFTASGSYSISAAMDASLSPAEAGLTLGSTFGGDSVIARLMSARVFGDTVMAAYVTINAADYLGMNFAIVWFNTLTTDAFTVTGYQEYGIARGGDWRLPLTNAGTFPFGPSATNLDQITLGSSATAATGQSINFATNGTPLIISIPEPSVAVLGALGALTFLRRRRR